MLIKKTIPRLEREKGKSSIKSEKEWFDKTTLKVINSQNNQILMGWPSSGCFKDHVKHFQRHIIDF